MADVSRRSRRHRVARRRPAARARRELEWLRRSHRCPLAGEPVAVFHLEAFTFAAGPGVTRLAAARTRLVRAFLRAVIPDVPADLALLRAKVVVRGCVDQGGRYAQDDEGVQRRHRQLAGTVADSHCQLPFLVLPAACRRLRSPGSRMAEMR